MPVLPLTGDPFGSILGRGAARMTRSPGPAERVARARVIGRSHEAGPPRPVAEARATRNRRGGNGGRSLPIQLGRFPQHQVRRPLRPGRQERRRPGHGPSRLRVHRPHLQQRDHHRRRPRPGATPDRRVHRLPAQHAGRPPPDPRRPAAGGQRPERLAHAGVPEPAGLLRGVAGRQAQGPRGKLRVGHPRLRHLPAREARGDRLHAGGGHRPAPHLVHGRPLRLRLHPLRRVQRPHPRVVDMSDPRRPEVAGRWWIPGMWRGGDESPDLAQGPPLRPAPRPGRRQPRLRRLARRGPHRARRRRSDAAPPPRAPELGPALRRRHPLAAPAARPGPPGGRRRAHHHELQPGSPLRLDVRRPRAEQSREHRHLPVPGRGGLLQEGRKLRAAQPPREPPRRPSRARA